MTQKRPSEFLLTASGIQHRVPRRTVARHTAQAFTNAPRGTRPLWQRPSRYAPGADEPSTRPSFQSGARPGAAPASISAAVISACLPESVGRGSLVTEDPREVSPLSRRGDVVRGGLTLYPIHYRAALASSLIPSPLPHQPPLQSAFPRGEATGLLRSSLRSLRGRVVPFGRWCVIRDGGHCSPRTWPRTFWSKPDSIFGLSLDHWHRSSDRGQYRSFGASHRVGH